ncbi:MAG: zinc metallopeptidase [Clostridia bacterium]|nr:zinc metallopeptidase [Clostridia bacterium]
MYYYWIFLGLLLLCAIFAGQASAKVHKTFSAYQELGTRSHATGYDTARRLLRANGISDISIGKVRGFLTDHYHPTKKTVNLSESVYGNDSVAAVAVAAHEIGHVVQKKKGYLPYKLRTVLVPITNIGSRLALPLVLVGLLLDMFVYTTQNSDLGFYLALVGVALYGLATVFALVTLPVEFNASKRAKRMLIEEGILTEEEAPYAEEMLSAAAQTYVASLLTSLVYFLRFALWVLILFGGRSRRR